MYGRRRRETCVFLEIVEGGDHVPGAPRTPVALQPGEGEARWFLGALTTIKASGETTGGRVAVTENWAPRGHGSPLHVHHNEDEWFYVLSGELTFWVDGETDHRTAPARSCTALGTCRTPSP